MTDELERKLKQTEQALPTGSLARLWKMGRTASRIGAALLRGGQSAEQAEAVARALGDLKGLAMKAGQLISYLDVTVPDELRSALAVLQQAAQPSRYDEVAQTVREALGARAEPLLLAMERAPMAVASIGQVHRARLPSGEEVAVKVRHPGIERALSNDFDTAKAGSSMAAVLGFSADAFVKEARDMLLAECDYRLEASRQARFGELWAADPVIRIPRVVPELCAEPVLTTALMTGRRFDDFRASATQAERDVAGEALYRFHVSSLYRHRLFHADPHPGNYAFRTGAALEVVVYDFGCVREFPSAIVEALARTADGVRRDDMPAAFGALAAVGATPPTDVKERQLLRGLLRGFFAPLLVPGRRVIDLSATHEARDLVADKRRVARLRLPAEMLFLFRLRFGLYAVLSRLGAQADWSQLETEWAREARLTESVGRSAHAPC